jgi:predicted nucleic acid-binding protein
MSKFPLRAAFPNTGEHGRALMLAGYSKLKPADASHLAAALVSNVDEMHTFDVRLLALDGKLDRIEFLDHC